MNTNLNKIALDLYGKIQTRFPNIKIGDENAQVLSKKADIPNARFFEFEYKDNGKSLGTVAITLDEDDGIVVQVSGELADSQHHGAFKFIRSFRQFAKDRLLNFDVQNIGKDQLDKRDYAFRAKPKEEEPMEPIMENKLYGTAKISYQDLGEARLVIKHSQPVNQDLAAGRTMHIEGIYVENSQGERFRYPYKHLNGARALAEHIKAGGNPYDAIGQHITSLSEELAQLRKFKNYVGRNDTLSEAMDDVNHRVAERIEAVKKEVHNLQRPAYYSQFAESFTAQESQEIPEEILNDWIDRLTIRSFNEELKTAFPYIYRLIGENIPVKELTPDDLLAEKSVSEPQARLMAAAAHDPKFAKKVGMKQSVAKEFNKADTGSKMLSNAMKHKKKAKEESYLEAFLDSIVNEDEEGQDGENTLFSPNKSTQQSAIDKFNEIMKTELKGGPEGINIIDSLKGLIDDPEFLEKMKDIDPDLDARGAIQQELNAMAKDDPELARIIPQLDFKGDGGEAPMGGEQVPPDAGATPPAPPEAAAPAEPVPPGAPAAPPAPGAEAGAPPVGAPPAPPIAESANMSKLRAKFIKARECGAQLDHEMDFGHKTMTLHDAIRECGLTPMECGFGDEEGEDSHLNGVEQMLKSVSGFWNREAKNFTIGGTRAKTRIAKGFKDGEFPNATEQDLQHVFHTIDKMDPSEHGHHDELGRIKQLAHGQHNSEVDEGSDEQDFSTMMQQFMDKHQGADVDGMLDKYLQSHPDAKVTRNNTSSGTINGKSASYDDAMGKFKDMAGGMGFDASGDDPMGGMMKGLQGKMSGMMGKMPQGQSTPGSMGNPQDMMKGMMGKMQGQMPNQNVKFPGGQMNPQDMMKGMMGQFGGMNETDELSNILKIAGVKK